MAARYLAAKSLGSGYTMQSLPTLGFSMGFMGSRISFRGFLLHVYGPVFDLRTCVLKSAIAEAARESLKGVPISMGVIAEKAF